MFRNEGSGRSTIHNQILAGYLAAIAGFVNSVGFLLLGSFTSHVTGNVGRFADDLALGRTAALFAAMMVITYFAGAFVASMALESNVLRKRPYVYGSLLLGEAGLLATFTLLSYFMDTRNPRVHDGQAMVLCFAMGLQNSLVTRLSGAIVRTTHLTGVVTDLGIEAARWFRLWRAQVGHHTHLRLTAGDRAPVVPRAATSYLLLTILIAFVAGSAAGAVLSVGVGHAALLAPVALLVAGGVFAISSGFTLGNVRGEP